MSVLISICIPAYKNAAFLSRLLDSIAHQTFKDFEVIISDDSPDNELETIIEFYKRYFPIVYHKNTVALGSPANWNNAIQLAKGKWIKLMHNDDWFAHTRSLEIFAAYTMQSNVKDFIFSAHHLYENDKMKSIEKVSFIIENQLRKNPLILFRKNYIGHPSTILIKNNRDIWYDENIKWVVDFEFYIRALKKTDFIYINQPLINIGLGEHQITQHVFRNRDVEIPENIYLLNKLGKSILNNIVVYDYYWRLLRNLQIRNWNEFADKVQDEIPDEIKSMFNIQKKYALKMLNKGIVSKLLMFSTYLKGKIK